MEPIYPGQNVVEKSELLLVTVETCWILKF